MNETRCPDYGIKPQEADFTPSRTNPLGAVARLEASFASKIKQRLKLRRR